GPSYRSSRRAHTLILRCAGAAGGAELAVGHGPRVGQERADPLEDALQLGPLAVLLHLPGVAPEVEHAAGPQHVAEQGFGVGGPLAAGRVDRPAHELPGRAPPDRVADVVVGPVRVRLDRGAELEHAGDGTWRSRGKQLHGPEPG